MENTFFLDIYSNLEEDARAHGHEVVVTNTDYQSQRLVAIVFFFKQKTAYEIHSCLEFRRVLFRSQWAKLFWSRRAHPGGDVNLHVRVAGSANERLALLFRDLFRAHPEAIPAYGSFKRSLAAVTPDL